MTDIALLYASHDGQTRKIALYLSALWRGRGMDVALQDLLEEGPDPQEGKAAAHVVLMAPIRYGYPLPSMDAFIRQNRDWLESKPYTVVLLNLTARKAGKDTPATNPYMRKWIKKQRLNPTHQAVFAGKLHYALYRWWEKLMIRLIMKITGGPTNLDANVDFTRWDRVEALADQIATDVKKEHKAA